VAGSPQRALPVLSACVTETPLPCLGGIRNQLKLRAVALAEECCSHPADGGVGLGVVWCVFVWRGWGGGVGGLLGVFLGGGGGGGGG
jgi:hypothetical protein